ncbi:MAG: DegV family protein [Chloroflexota bacterium]|nr:DegV family protein [Ardenticatenaceae bacterium]
MRIVMDSVGDVPTAIAQELQIAIVPVNITFGDEAFLAGVTMDHAAFYRKVETVTAVNFPKTAQPTPYQFLECYKEILATGETEILTIVVSQKLAGTMQSVRLAAEMLEGQGKFYAFDSMGGSAAQGYLAIEAARMARAGVDFETIIARLTIMRDATVTIFTIDSLEYALKGGRVSAMKSIMASMLSIKPVLQLTDGEIIEAGRVRTRKKAIQHIVDEVQQRVGDTPVKTAVIHAHSPADAQTLQALAAAQLNLVETIEVEMSIAVAINLGPGALGLVAVPV